jgi:hypothetical protein
MVMLVPALFSDGLVPAAAAGLTSMAIPVLVLAGLLCVAAVLLVAARTVDR